MTTTRWEQFVGAASEEVAGMRRLLVVPLIVGAMLLPTGAAIAVGLPATV